MPVAKAASDRHRFRPPTRKAFIRLITNQEDACLRFSDRQLSRLGDKAPITFSHLGAVLSLLDRMSACYWRCNGGDHLAERLAGRCCSSARASLRLLRSGYYDESLSLTRSVAEAANLLFLFWHKPQSLSDWKAADDRARWNGWRPAQVRKKLEALNVLVPASDERYSEYCEIGTHLTPHTWPQAHNPQLKPTLGGYYQQMGYLVCLNELAQMTALATFSAAHVIKLNRDKRKLIAKSCIALIRNTGAIDVLNVPPQYYGSENAPASVKGPHTTARVVTSRKRATLKR